jgi:prepilin-type N-terminal cleavage/methylation domain-containing protein
MRRLRGFTMIELMVVISIIVILIALFAGRNFTRARARAQFTACCGNLKSIATACQSYSVENDGHYPPSLGVVTPKYLRAMPTCPSAGFATYDTGTNYSRSTNPDAYTISCGPSFHKALGKSATCPQYTAARGLISEE